MSILTGNQLQNRASDVFVERDHCIDDCVNKASYHLRVNNEDITLGGKRYTASSPHPEHEPIDLPPEQISVLSTVEQFELADDICARVGLRYQASKRGLIALFGPQIEPGYEGPFYAIVYNPTSRPIRVHYEEQLFKMEVHALPESTGELRSSPPPEIPAVDHEAPAFNELKSDIEHLEDEVRSNAASLDELESGYRVVLLFGVFLITTSIFGVVLTYLLESMSVPGFELGWNLPTVATLALVGGWGFVVLAVVGYVVFSIVGTLAADRR